MLARFLVLAPVSVVFLALWPIVWTFSWAVDPNDAFTWDDYGFAELWKNWP